MAQLWMTNSLGGYMYSDNLSKELRTAVQPGLRFRQFADVKDPEQNQRHAGAVFHWNVFSDVATAGGTLVETTAMPETNFTITQGTLTINEYGNSVPYTGKLDALSEQPVKEIIHKVLKNDCKKTLDTAVHDQFKATVLRVAPTGGTNTSTVVLTTNGTCTQTNNVALGKNHVKAIIDEMKERNIPPYTDDDYFCIARPSTFRTFKNDLEGVKEYTETGYGDIVRGEIGRYEGCRFVEQTNIAAGSGSTAAAAWTNSKSDWAFFMGEDTVAEAVAIPEEIRGKIPGDFGRDKGVAWYALLGYGIVHTAAAQSRIVMWDSAK
jgi:N4-gp56 family major capsid protein